MSKESLKGKEEDQRKLSWLETIRNDIKTYCLIEEITLNREGWRDRIDVANH